MSAKHSQNPDVSDSSAGSGQVIPFRPRTSEHPPHPENENAAHGLPDGRAEQDDADDFKHRMLANIAALVFLVGLTGGHLACGQHFGFAPQPGLCAYQSL